MQVRSLFDLVTDGRDLLDYLDGVETRDQLVTRLERLKHQGPDGLDEMLECIEGLRTSLTKLLDDVLEMSASVDEEKDDDLDAELDELADEVEDEPAEVDDSTTEISPAKEEISPETLPEEKPKNDVPPAA
jgi:gas vesicle protein